MLNSQSTVQVRDKFIFWGYLAIICFAPLPFGSNVIFAWPILVIGSGMLGLAWLVQYFSGRVVITVPFRRAWPIHIIWVLWLAWLILQVISLPISWIELLSPKAAEIQRQSASLLGHPQAMATLTLDLWATQSSILKTFAYVSMFMLGLLVINTRERIKILAWVLVYSGLFQALYGSMSVLAGFGNPVFHSEGAQANVATGTYINRNHLAGYLVMSLSMGTGLMLSMLDGEKYASWKSWLRGWLKVFLSAKLRLRLYLVLMVIALVMTHSRMGNVSFFVALTVSGVITLAFTRWVRRSMIILVVSLIVVDVIVIGAWFGIDKVAQRLEQTLVIEEVQSTSDSSAQPGAHIRVSDQGRESLYRDMSAYWKSFWLTGSGLGSFEYVYPLYRGADIKGHYDHAHNDYLEFLAETGVPGLLILATVILYALLAALSALRRRRDGLMRGMGFSGLMSMTALLIHSAVDFNLQIPANAMTMVVILMIACLSNTLPSRRQEKST